MKNCLRVLFSLFLLATGSDAQQPRLVVVISLDQFPYEYITKYRDYFTEGGFNYLLKSGANYVDCRYLHAATKTGPGHAVIMSGAYGNITGIIENVWFDGSSNSQVYCVEDRSATLVGTSTEEGRSPRNFIGATLGDQLKIHTGFQSKVISISNKDRAAILMGGKLADAAYWSEDSLFVTSSYYRKDLPGWMISFNNSGWFRAYFGREWNLMVPEREYRKQGSDDGVGEADYYGGGTRFPHVVDGGNPKLITKNYSYALLTSPFSAEILAQLAQVAVKEERLGQRGMTDILCVGFSSIDYVGHVFGPQSWEVMDLTVRMDRLLEEFFSFLDSHIGLKNCLIVLTGDHGVAPIPETLIAANPNVDAGRIQEDQLLGPTREILNQKFGTLTSSGDWFHVVEGGNIYINQKALQEKGLQTETVANIVREEISKLPFVAAVYTAADLSTYDVSGDLAGAFTYSFHPRRSGDVMLALKPYYLFGDPKYPTGTAHGSPYSYDSHVPLILAGPGIKPGTYFDRVSPADIAPTLAALLGVEMPPVVQGRVLKEAIGGNSKY